MRIETLINSEDKTIMIFPKSAPAGEVAHFRRVIKIEREYTTKNGNLVFVLKD